MPTTRKLRPRAAALVALACVLPVAGCASSRATTSATEGVAEVPRLHAMLPASIRNRGTLEVVTDASYAPASSFGPNGRTIVGFEPDLGAALGRELGVKVRFRDADFGTLPRLVSAGRADLIMSAMTDTAGREKGLDFVDYFSAGTVIVTQRGNPHGVSDLGSLCGQKVAVQNDTVQLDLLKRLQPRCAGAPVRLSVASTNDDALVQLRTGQVAAVPMDYPPAELVTTSSRTSGEYQLASTEQYEPGLYGIGVAKDDNALTSALRGALDRLIRSGDYKRILARWHVTSGAVARASVNAAAKH